MEWIIKPYEGVGEIRFGMKSTEVMKLIGPPRTSKPKGSWLQFETRALEDPFLSYDAKGLGEVTFPPQFPALMFENHNVFVDDPIEFLKLVWKRDHNLVETFGTTISLKLGLAFGEFQPGSYVPNRSVTLFRRGMWTAEECAMFDPVDYSKL